MIVLSPGHSCFTGCSVTWSPGMRWASRCSEIYVRTYSLSLSHTHTVPAINYTHPVRLYLNGSYGINEGTVEILNRTTGEWGSVCDDYFGFEEATVVCQMLGFRAAIRSYSRFGMLTSYRIKFWGVA